MDVSVIITCWNGKALLQKHLPKVIRAAENPNNKIKEIIVVDDASTDDSVTFLEREFPKIKIVRHLVNQGYAAVCNTGVKQSKGDLVAILNADVEPLEDFLEKALPYFNDKKTFSVTFAEGKFGPGKLIWKEGFLEIEPTAIPDKAVLTDWANGGSSVFQKKIWEELGGMDELFLPFYFEDIDLGIRARQKGYQCWWEPKARVVHEHEATINPANFARYQRQQDIAAIKERNHLLLTWKNINTISLCLFHLCFLLRRCLFHPGYNKIIWLTLRYRLSNSLRKDGKC